MAKVSKVRVAPPGKETDSLNLHTPLLDAVDSAGTPGQVLLSQGAGKIPVWGDPGAGGSSGSSGSIEAAKLLHEHLPGDYRGRLIVVAPFELRDVSSFSLIIEVGTDDPIGHAGVDLFILHVDLNGPDLIKSVTIQGTASAHDVCLVHRASDNRYCIVLGHEWTDWHEPHVIVRDGTFNGSGSLVALLSGWSIDLLPPGGSTLNWEWYMAQPVGPYYGLPTGDATTYLIEGDGRGVFSAPRSHGSQQQAVGGYSAEGVVTGAIAFLMTHMDWRECIEIRGQGCGDPPEMLVLTLSRAIDRNQAQASNRKRFHVYSPMPTIPDIAVAEMPDAQGTLREWLLIGNPTQVWTDPAIAVTLLVTNEDYDDHRRIWPAKLITGLSNATGVIPAQRIQPWDGISFDFGFY